MLLGTMMYSTGDTFSLAKKNIICVWYKFTFDEGDIRK
jgi:hypothetical protein